MAGSSDVVANNKIFATDYNKLRGDVLDNTTGHDHEATDGKRLTKNALRWTNNKILLGAGAGAEPTEIDTPDIAIHAGLFTGVHGHDVVIKAADQIVNNSEVLVNDNHLLHAILANEVWLYELWLLVISATSTPDIDFTIVAPSGATGGWWTAGLIGNLSTQAPINPYAFGSTTYETRVETTLRYQLIFAYVKNNSTPGNVQLQWAQNVATSEDTKVLEDSYLRASRIG